MFKRFLLVMALSPVFSAGAQSLCVQFADTACCAKSIIAFGNRKGVTSLDLKFHGLPTDASGCYTTDSVALPEGMAFCPGWMYVGATPHSFIYQPGVRLDVKVDRGSDGNASVSYEGVNAAASRCFDEYEKRFNYDEYFIYPPENDTVSVEDKRKLLDGNYSYMMAEVGKLPAGGVRDFLKQLTEDAYLNFQIRFADKSQANELLKKVDLNSWIGLYNYLPEWAFESYLPEPDYESDMTQWGLGYLDLLKEKITDPTVRERLLDNVAKYVLSWGKSDDVDTFWSAFVGIAGEGSPVVREYTNLVNSLKRNKAGKPAPDITFKDRDGKSHKLSEYYGKVLYIDCWASWCGPCRKEIPYIEKHYKEYYKDNDRIAFISISMDEDRDAWLRIIDKDKPEWLQFIASGEDAGELSRAYGIMGIPRFIIINTDGTIVDADAFRPSDEDFREKIDGIINAG